MRCRTGGAHSLQFTMAWIAVLYSCFCTLSDWWLIQSSACVLLTHLTHTHAHTCTHARTRTHTHTHTICTPILTHPHTQSGGTPDLEFMLRVNQIMIDFVGDREKTEWATISVYHTCRECTSPTYFTLLNQSVNRLGVCVFCFSGPHTVKPQSPSDLSGCCYHQWGVKSEQRWGCIPAVSMYAMLITQWPYSLVIHVLHSLLGRLSF